MTWSRPELVLWPDLADDSGSFGRIEEVRSLLDVPDDLSFMRTEFYDMGFYLAESCTLAFPWLFTINNNARYGNHAGPRELQLAVPRDLLNWERPFREPCVPRGGLADWDRGFFVTQSRAIRVGNEVWLYYGGSSYTHGTPCLYRSEATGRGTTHTGSIGLAPLEAGSFRVGRRPPRRWHTHHNSDSLFRRPPGNQCQDCRGRPHTRRSPGRGGKTDRGLGTFKCLQRG